MAIIQRFSVFYSVLLTIVVVLTTVGGAREPQTTTKFDEITVKKINVVEDDGTLRAVLASSGGFNFGQRAEGGPVRIAGLMFYNEEGQETGGLVYRGHATPVGQDADVTLTMDQYRQDQNIYLHHEELKDAKGLRIDDGLTVNQRPDWTQVKGEYQIYSELRKLPADQVDDARLQAAQAGKISTRRLFFGVLRGVKDGEPFNDGGIFIKNRWGRDAIKIYVDQDNKPHFEVYDALGKSVIYELKLKPEGRPKKKTR